MARVRQDERFGVGKIKKILEVEAVLWEEGGAWVAWKMCGKLRMVGMRGVHAIRFKNGMIWDVVNGWRE